MNKAAAEGSITELIEPECVSFSTPAEAEPHHIQQIIKTLSIIFSLLNVQQVSATIAVYFCWFHSGHLLDVSQYRREKSPKMQSS